MHLNRAQTEEWKGWMQVWRSRSYCKYLLDCPVRFAPYILVTKESRRIGRNICYCGKRYTAFDRQPPKTSDDSLEIETFGPNPLTLHTSPNPKRTIQMRFRCMEKSIIFWRNLRNCVLSACSHERQERRDRSGRDESMYEIVRFDNT